MLNINHGNSPFRTAKNHAIVKKATLEKLPRWKVTKIIVATRCQILRVKCTKFEAEGKGRGRRWRWIAPLFKFLDTPLYVIHCGSGFNYITNLLRSVALAFGPRCPGSHPGYATNLLGSNLRQLFTHIASPLPSLVSSKNNRVQKGVFVLDRFNGFTD